MSGKFQDICGELENGFQREVWIQDLDAGEVRTNGDESEVVWVESGAGSGAFQSRFPTIRGSSGAQGSCQTFTVELSLGAGE